MILKKINFLSPLTEVEDIYEANTATFFFQTSILYRYSNFIILWLSFFAIAILNVFFRFVKTLAVNRH